MNAQTIETMYLSLPIVPRFKSPTGNDEFVREIDYDMTTFAGRIAWFCDEFEVDRPVLELDPEEPPENNAVLVTDALINWCRSSGICMNFAFAGSVRGCVDAQRQKNLLKEEIVEQVDDMAPNVKAGFAAMIKAVVQQGVPIKEAHAVFEQVVQEWQVAKS